MLHKSFSRFLILLLISQLSIGAFAFQIKSASAAGTTYYVDNCVVTGNDSNNGTSPSTPWLTVAQVNAHSFNPGDSILLQGGCTWREQLSLGSSGSAGNPITVGSYGSGQAIIDGSNILSFGWTNTVVASGTVTQANMRLSMATSTSFVDFNASGTLTSYIGDEITITDSSGHHLVGYIKAAGTGQTYGSQLLGNTTFTTTSGVNAIGSTIAAVTSTCFSSNCLQITYTTSGQAYQSFTQSEGVLLRSLAYGKLGTASFLGMYIQEGQGSFSDLNAVFYGGSWASSTVYATTDLTGTSWWQSFHMGSANGTTAYVDSPSVAQVLTPSTTGVTITSSAKGSTYNWTSEQSGFNRNDSSGYTYSITLPNIWQVAFAPSYIANAWVFFNGVAGGHNGGNPQSSLVSVTSTNEWYWNGASTLYVYSTSDPTTAFTSPGIEATERVGVQASNQSYVTFNNLDVKDTSQSCFDLYQLAHGTVENSTMSYCGKVGVFLYNSSNSTTSTPSDYYTVANNTISYTADNGIGGNNANNGLIYGNDVSHAGVMVDDRSAIEVIGSSANNRIYDNYCHDDTDQTGPVGIRGIEDDTITSPDVNYIYNNLVARNNGTGIIVQSSANQQVYDNISYDNTTGVGGNDFISGIKDSQGSGNIYYNNTTYNNQFAEMQVTNDSGIGPIIKNNIFYASASGSGAIFANGATPTSSVANYNLVYGNSIDYNWGGTTYAAPATFFSATGQGQHDISSNPQFVSTSTPQFNLQASSPAIDAGVILGGSYDMGLDSASAWPVSIILDNQNNYGAGWDIGAYVYTQTSAPSVLITTPASAATVSGSSATVSASSSAVSPSSIASIQFYLDGSPLDSAGTSSPYSITWDTTQTTNGSHILTALATDNYGNSASSSISLSVANAISSGGVSVGVASAYASGGSGDIISPPAPSSISSTTATVYSTSSIQAQLNSLLAELAVLEAVAGQASPSMTPVSSPPFIFTRDLQLHDTGNDVKALQKILNSKGFIVSPSGPGSAGDESTYFGSKTREALVKFQKSVGISPDSGYFGSITRKYVNGL